MSLNIKACLFWVQPVDGDPADVARSIAQFARKPKSLDFQHDGQDYLAENLTWTARAGVLSGTVYRVQSHAIPAAIKGKKTAKDLPLNDDEDVGTDMHFAFVPDPGVALIHYAHNGPRHSTIAPLLSRIGYPHAISVEPVIRTDMLERLKGTSYVSKMEFSLRDPKGMAELREVGGAVGHSIKLLEDLGGVSIHVTISMGHEQGDGLFPDAAKKLARKLASIATDNVHSDDPAHVKTVKIKGSSGDGAPLEELDMLRARERIELTVDEQNRRLKGSDCQRKLVAVLQQRLPELRRQLGV